MNSIIKLGATALMGATLAMPLAGCVIVDADVQEGDWSRMSGGGLLYGAEVSVRGPGEVSIVAHSNGCTQKEDFRADVDGEGNNTFRVRFERTREDNCKALVPEGKRMTWSYGELGVPQGAKVIVSNRVGR
jgi:hypothetical protein